MTALSAPLWHRIASEPDRPAWITQDGETSYGALARAVRRRTAALRALGLGPGDRVMLVSRDDAAAFATWLAVLLDGGAPILVAPDAGADRVAGLVRAAGARRLLTDADRLAELAPAVPDGAAHDIAALDGPDEAEPSLAVPEDGIAYILFTSGTTSASKGVVITHANLAAQLDSVARVFRVGPAARVYNGLVLYHVDGLVQGPLLCAWAGAALLRPPPFQPARIEADLGWLAAEGGTHMVGAPALYEMILRGAARDDYFARPDFVALLSSSAPLMPRTWDALEARFGVPVVNEYGMTETVAASHFAGALPEMGGRHTIGRPVDCEARIADPEGRDLPPGEAGELLLRGPNIFGGYLDDPDRTAEAFRDGWFRTGDLVVETPEGDHRIVGRIKSAIKFAGFLIRPEEIDEAVRAHPGVEDSVTVGLEDATFGEVPATAFTAAAPVAPEAVLATCRTRLEARKVPRRVLQVEALPRTGSGKADLGAVRALLSAARAASPAGDDVGARVREVAASVFGLPAAALSDESTPDTTPGWDSFSQTTLALETEEAFGIELPAADVLSFDSLGALAAAVARVLGPGEAEAKEDAPTRLQTLTPGGGGGTLVAMPDIGGRTEYVRRIVAALDPALSMRALSVDPRGVDPEARPTLHDLASDLAGDLLAADLPRPLVLLGHSFAGYLAYEAAAVLAARGAPVDAVVLLDTAVPWRHRRDAWLRRPILATQTLSAALRGRGPNDRVLQEPGYWRIEIDAHPDALEGVLRSWYPAMTAYAPGDARTPLLVLAAARRWDMALLTGPDLGWKDATSAPVEVVRLGADHLSQVRDADTAARVAEALGRHVAGLAVRGAVDA